MKFGQLVDLEALDKMASSEKSKRLESDLGAQEAQQRSEFGDAKTDALRIKQQILSVTQENTTLLRAIGELTAQQLALERELNSQASTGVNVGDSEPTAKAEAEERQRLMQVRCGSPGIAAPLCTVTPHGLLVALPVVAAVGEAASAGDGRAEVGDQRAAAERRPRVHAVTRVRACVCVFV